MGMQFEGLNGVYELVKKLRSKDGCPWDRKQTNKSIKNDLIEEAYEVIDAIEREDDNSLMEELGDLLFLVLMHIRIKEEEGSFTLLDVTSGIIDKMIYRHPHVFGNVRLETEEELLKQWEKSKKGKSLKEFPLNQPSLLGLERLIKRLKSHDMSEDEILTFCRKDKNLKKIIEGAIGMIKENKSPEDELRALMKRFLSKK